MANTKDDWEDVPLTQAAAVDDWEDVPLEASWGQKALNAVGMVGKAVDSYGGDASSRAAIYALQKGKNPAQAAISAYGDSDSAPTGKMIAEEAGIEDAPLPESLNTIGRAARDYTPFGIAYKHMAPKSVQDMISNASQSDLAGIGIDMTASPLGFSRPIIKGATGLSELVSNSVKASYLGKKGQQAMNAAGRGAAKVGEWATGIPKQDIMTYAEKGDEVKKMMNEAGWNIPEAADQIRDKMQTAIRNKKTSLGSQIEKTIEESDATPNISTKPIIDTLSKGKDKLDDIFQSADKAELDRIISKIQEASVPEYFKQAIPNALKSNPSADYSRRMLDIVDELTGKEARKELTEKGKNLLQFLRESLESRTTPKMPGTAPMADDAIEAAKAAGKDYVENSTTFTFDPDIKGYKPKYRTHSADPAYQDAQRASFGKNSGKTYKEKLLEIIDRAQKDTDYAKNSAASDAGNVLADQGLSALDKLTEWANAAGESAPLKKVGDVIDEKTNLKYLNMIKGYLQNKAQPSYMENGQIFQSAPMAANISKKGGAVAREILNRVSPDIAKANKSLSEIHELDNVIPDRLIAPGKSEAALLAAGSGQNERNINNLKELGRLTEQDMLTEAQLLSAGRRFYNPSWSPVDTTGKSVYRAGVGAGLGGGTAHILGLDPKIGAILGAASTSPAALKLAIDSGRAISKLPKKALDAANKIPDKALKYGFRGSRVAKMQNLSRDYETKEKLKKETDFSRFGKYSKALEAAAKRGEKSLSTTISILMTDPQFRRMVENR